MAKKRISFDIDVPNGYTAFVKKKKKPRKASKRVKAAKDGSSMRIVRPIEIMMPVNKRRRSRKKKAKSKKSTVYKEAYGDYKKKLLLLMTRFVEDEFEVLVEWAKDLLSVKKKMRVMTWYAVFLISGATVALFGIAKLLDCVCTKFYCGLSYVLVGIVAILIGMIYKKIFL